MALFIWNDKFLTGINEIDEQHKKLISLVNDLHDAMKAKKAKDIIEKLLTELGDYTVYHFTTEEKAFEKYGYGNKDEHKRYHADFVNKVNELIERHKRSEIALSIDILNFLVTWVQSHILVEDMKYVPQLKGKAFM